MEIAIIGGGIGGLAMAIALRQQRFEPAVYERAATLEPVGAGITLWPNAIRALRKRNALLRRAPGSLAKRQMIRAAAYEV